MGQAKQRGSFEERKALAEKHAEEEFKLRSEILRRRPSPKHTRLIAQILALGLSNNHMK